MSDERSVRDYYDDYLRGEISFERVIEISEERIERDVARGLIRVQSRDDILDEYREASRRKNGMSPHR